ncbi:hypothetical protein [Flagellimonas sp. GZD32]|uniref:hypothetical protein n=1 Tax=Flagellimonas cixiensis TaxID=3228750 RepID=UPI0035C9355E
MAICMFVFYMAHCNTATLATNPPDYATIKGWSFGTLSPEDRINAKDSCSTIEVVPYMILVVMAIGALSVFTG